MRCEYLIMEHLFMWMSGMIYEFCIYVYVLCCISPTWVGQRFHHYVIRICHFWTGSAAGDPTDRASTFPRFPIRLEISLGSGMESFYDTPPSTVPASRQSSPRLDAGDSTPDITFTPRRAMASFENLVALANHQERLREARKMMWRDRGEPVVELDSLKACLRHAGKGAFRK